MSVQNRIGVTQKGPSPRHLLPRLAMAGPSVPPRAQSRAFLQLPIQLEAEGSLHQPLPLRSRRNTSFAASSCPEVLRSHSGTADAVSANACEYLPRLTLFNSSNNLI